MTDDDDYYFLLLIALVSWMKISMHPSTIPIQQQSLPSVPFLAIALVVAVSVPVNAVAAIVAAVVAVAVKEIGTK